MFSCKDACDKATDYLEGSDTFGERLNMRLHLMICRECRRFYRQFQLTVGAAAKVQNIDAPTDQEIDALVRKLSERASR